MKPLKIIWTPQSQEDLREIYDFIARDAPITAEAFVRRLRSAVGRLRQFPESGSVATEVGNPKIREVLYGAYRIRSDQIDVLTVFHGARLLDEWQL